MDSFSPLVGGFGLQLSLIVAVGAQNTYVLRQGLRREHVGVIVAFCALADAGLTAAGVAGLGAAGGRVPWLTPALTAGGAAFLLWYGGSALRRALRPGALAADLGGAATPLGAALSRVAGFTLLNPHVYLDTVLLVGAVGAAHAAADRPGFVLGAAAASAAWFAALGYGARLLAPAFAQPAAWRVLDAVVAAIMLTLAAGLAMRALGGAG